MAHWTIHTDGAARNNPGPAGAGLVIDKDDQPIVQEGFYLGSKTNNQAEYLALLLALFLFKKYGKPGDTVDIAADSSLMINQVTGVFKVKNGHLQPLVACARDLLPEKASLYHIPREENTRADALANQGIDQKKPVPSEFIRLIADYGITL